MIISNSAKEATRRLVSILEIDKAVIATIGELRVREIIQTAIDAEFTGRLAREESMRSALETEA